MTASCETVRGYAKINLHLDITGRMADGYHRVETVMQTVSLCDTVTVKLTEGGRFSVLCDREGVPTDGQNIAARAARLLAASLGTDRGAEIIIEKRIPMAAGLAGGSADAAATLLAMNRLLGEPLSQRELCHIGARLGADVPFCIVGGTKYADGRGDVLHELPPMPDCTLVVACGGEGVSTPWGYGLLDRRYRDFGEDSDYRPRSTEALRKGLADGDLQAIGSAMYNIFEVPVLEHRPVAAAIRKLMLRQGAAAAMMSGSGPSVFGIFCDGQAAEAAVRAIQAMDAFAAVCRPV